MGNKLTVKYKATRGSHQVDDIIEDPYDFFEALLVSQRDNTMAMYERLSAEQK